MSEVLLWACARGSAPARNVSSTWYFQGFFESQDAAIKIYSIDFPVQSNYPLITQLMLSAKIWKGGGLGSWFFWILYFKCMRLKHCFSRNKSTTLPSYIACVHFGKRFYHFLNLGQKFTHQSSFPLHPPQILTWTWQVLTDAILTRCNSMWTKLNYPFHNKKTQNQINT